MTTQDVLMIVAALSVGAWVQGAIGFGSAIVAVPVMIWGGLTLPEAVSAVLASVVVQTAAGCRQFRDALVIRDVWPMFGLRVVAMPVGVMVMAALATLEPAAVKQFVGAVVLLAVGIVARDQRRQQRLMTDRVAEFDAERGAPGQSKTPEHNQTPERNTPSEQIGEFERPLPHAAWTPVAGLGSGLMAGAVGMGGPALVLWAHTRPWSTRRTRVFLWCSFLSISPLQLGLLVWKFGPEVGWMALWGLVATPLVVAAAWLGTRAGDRLSVRQFKSVALVLLALIGLASLAGPWVGLG